MRFKMTREFYVPKGSIKVTPKGVDAVAYLYTTKAHGKPGAMVFFGKQAKPVLHCYFADENRRSVAVIEYFARKRAWDASKAEQRKARTASPRVYKVGDLLRTSWGYEQTNVEFFEVTALVGSKMVELREIAQERTETGFMQGTCSPVPGKYIGPAIKRVATGDRSVKIDDVRRAYPASTETNVHWSSYH